MQYMAAHLTTANCLKGQWEYNMQYIVLCQDSYDFNVVGQNNGRHKKNTKTELRRKWGSVELVKIFFSGIPRGDIFLEVI